MSQPPSTGDQPPRRPESQPDWPPEHDERTERIAWPTAERAEPEWPTSEVADDAPAWPFETATPAHGIPAQPPPSAPDRVWVHLAWEAVLLAGVLVAGLAVVAAGGDEALLTQAALRNLAQQAAVLGLLATGLALSLRVAAPNLAVGAIAGAAGASVAWLVNERDWALGTAALAVLAAALAVGLALAIVVVGLHVPAWAATLGAAAALVAVPLGLFSGQTSVLPQDVDVDEPWLWLAVFVVVSVAGGLLWAIPGVRTRLAGTRADRDPARRPGAAAGAGVTLGLMGSSLLAAGAGVVLLLGVRTFAPTSPFDQTVTALAAVLLGGVSVFGRRGGVFGTVLAVAVLVLLQHALAVGETEPWVRQLLIGGAIVVGLVVSRLGEFAGRKG